MTTISWGGSNFSPQPDNYRITDQFIGSASRMADGALRVDQIAEKARVILAFSGLTYAQLAAIRVIYDAKATTANTLALFDGRSYSVIGIQGGWQEGETENASSTALWYSLTITLDEV